MKPAFVDLQGFDPESRVDAGMPSTAAAPEGPETRPLVLARAFSIRSDEGVKHGRRSMLAGHPGGASKETSKVGRLWNKLPVAPALRPHENSEIHDRLIVFCPRNFSYVKHLRLAFLLH
jgi:hypothetical protein